MRLHTLLIHVLSIGCLCLTFCHAQQRYSISGIITDQSNGEPLLGATVVVTEKNQGVISNNYGFYSLRLPEGSYTLEISYLGFEPFSTSLALRDNETLDISLTPTNDQLDEVIVQSDDSKKSVVRSVVTGLAKLSQKEIKRIPPLLGEADITRALLTQPGISSVGEGTSGFNVRGGNIDQNLILLDEAPLYNATHLWGFFSAFNADAIKNMTLYKGNIPARFGGRASSVLDIRQREGNNKSLQGQGGIGLLFSRLTLEGLIKKDKLSFLLSGRQSYIHLLPKDFTQMDGQKIYFYDLNTKLSWVINNKNRLYLSGYFGADVLKLEFDDDDQNGEGSEDTGQNIDFSWRNATSTLRWNHIFGDQLFLNLSGIYSNYNYGLNTNSSNDGGPVSKNGIFDWHSNITTYVVKPDFTYYPSLNNTWRFGVNATYHQFLPAQITSGEKGLNSTKFPTEKGLEIAPYIEYEKKMEAYYGIGRTSLFMVWKYRSLRSTLL